MATKTSNTGAVACLAENGMNIDTKDNQGYTPLIYFNAQSSVIRVLGEAGAIL